MNIHMCHLFCCITEEKIEVQMVSRLFVRVINLVSPIPYPAQTYTCTYLILDYYFYHLLCRIIKRGRLP